MKLTQSKATKKTYRALHKNNNKAGYLFIAPLLIVFACFLLYSFYFLFKNSFHFVTISFKHPRFVGLNNYKTVLQDAAFYRSMLNTFLISFANIFAGLTLGYVVAVFLNFKLRLKRFFHALFFVPSMLPIALMAAVFSSMLEYKEGTFNQLLRFLGMGGLTQRWLSDPNLAIWSVMSVSVFLIGIPIMYYTADLTTISPSVMEAATIDGAKFHQVLFLVLYPMLKNTHKTIIISMLLGGFREMERVYLMTDGGPGGSTEIIGTYIYRATRSAGSNLGIVSAAAIIVLLIAFAISFIQMKLANRTSALQ
ncbi:multiple sugar transport system permease protein/raffinose/stachyose/melibiose transport system permease protein [Hydrogenoanaerobacterium saccharovorans]|uniref:Multiple sugar transport system permease protein/raffinose/stachyose/melibiose transport system permease protein n=1 Tax=Hydrogenoanaerobacterium saccharovorans TaxID=474960 RepID=A0A1H7Z5A0_9FIRM|nr:sugar ABC transporter permease [Hydrogenoanaerobacterium saccharovorans]RPF48855.1 multiple sugar transport system permease protein/raffinose/stachyose/melibiose transport system permease protein [Hydrogenoanaerobacterium saccharovorans]SEM52669.1 multiple sugar transport system permease protein/raffinose/stachyose/melibiose transport system permease protein [Hydrogenoanaerobacterium saccharovorans]